MSNVLAQVSDNELFQQGIKNYTGQKYREAQRIFLQIIKDYPHSKIQTATKLMLAKSYYKLADYNASSLVVNNFLNVHSNSDYIDDIHFLNGKIKYKQGKYRDAIEDWLWIIYHEGDSRLKRIAGTFVFHTMELYLSDNEITSLNKKYNDDTFNGLVEIVQAKKLINKGQELQGRHKLERFIEQYPYHLYAEVATKILRGETGAKVIGNSLLVLKSGNTETKPISDAIALGLFYSAYEMSERDKAKTLRVDTLSLKSDMLSSLNTVMAALEKFHPIAIVGPIEDDLNSTLALLSKYEFIPYISAVSSQNGLAALSNYAFQLNPDAELKGRYLAEYAVHELGFNTFAILAPANVYGQTIVKGFEEVIQENEKEIIEKQWYYENTEDFSRQFKAIRKRGFYITFRDSIEQSDSTLTEEDIREQFNQYLTENLFSDETGREIDSTQVPSTGIDGLFIVTYPNYINFISPQFAFQNIQTTILGNEGWNNPESLEQQRVYIDGIIYVSPGYFESNSWNYKAFLSRFRQHMKETPGKYHLLGYDLGKWMMNQYQMGVNRMEYRDRLENAPLYEGILENIKFGYKPRVNSKLNIIRYYMGQVLRVK
jgi:outer membrane protein assembly factor BamD (BamD/ComL family)/ABC-type branched-subunit amino acid transport system substrate-binding protein